MARLRVMGSSEVRDEAGRQLHSLLAQPKRFALLCYLAIPAPGRFHRRDTLLALFWADADTDRARHALRQAVYYLRRSLGDAAIVSRGDEEVGVAPDAVSCDVAEFEELLRQDRLEEALQLYRGELLPGFHLEEAREFDEWLEAERVRLCRRALDASALQIERLVAAGHTDQALQLARWRAALAPAEAEPVRRLMLLLEQAGDASAALGALNAYARRLAAEYELEPEPDLQRLARRLRAPTPPELDPLPPAPAAAAAHSLEGPRPARARARPRWLAPAVLAIGVAAIAVVLSRPGSTDRNPPDSGIVVFPFSVSSPDGALDYLSEGMAELIAVVFTGELGPRAVDRTAVLHASATGAASPKRMRDVALELGARHYISGSVVARTGTAGDDRLRIVVQAELTNALDGGTVGHTRADGPVDSFPAVADRVAGALLAASMIPGRAEGPADGAARGSGLAALTQQSLPALRAYLAGRLASQRGEFDSANVHFRRALDIDSTFAAAAAGLEYNLGIGFTRHPRELIARAQRLAWAGRHELSTREQLLLQARLGRNYPDWTPPGVQLAFLDSVSGIAPDDALLWYELGSDLLAGAHLRAPDWRRRAGAALRRALEIDSTLVRPRILLLDLLLQFGDNAGAEAVLEGFRRHGDGPFLLTAEWEFNAALRHARGEPEAETPVLHHWPEATLRRIVITAPSFGFGLVDAERALRILLERAPSSAERDRTLLLAREWALNRGRPTDAARILNELSGPGRAAPFRRERMREHVYYALYWDGDEEAGRGAAAELERTVARPIGQAGIAEPLRDVCVLEQWRLAHGDTATVSTSVDRLRRDAASAAAPEAARAHACAAMLEAMIAVARHAPDAPRWIDRFEALLVQALPNHANEYVWFCAGHLVAARLREASGDRTGALRALRAHGQPADRGILLSSLLREEGRLALLTRDTVAALRAYRHYLTLRSDPEPRLRADRTRVQRQVRRLARP